MRLKYFRILITNCFLYSLFSFSSFGQQQNKTVGLFLNGENSYQGYTLFSPFSQKQTFLINNEGKLIHMWDHITIPGHTVYLNEDGTLYRAGQVEDDPIKTHINGGGSGGRIELYDWDSKLLWEYEYADMTKRQHHDFQVLPNGNVLILAWEAKSKEEAIQAGRDPNTLEGDELWPDHLIEVKPQGQSGGEIVWEWHVWDHLVQDFDVTKENFGDVSVHPELVNLNYIKSNDEDWNHINSINYNPDLDEILLSVWAFDEIWIIDHSTTTDEAKGHTGGNKGKGGDLLYRWGNPKTYGKGDTNDQVFFQQHNVHWIPKGLPNEGKIMLFNNGTNRPTIQYSSINILDPLRDMNGNYLMDADGVYEPSSLYFNYSAPIKTDFFSGRFSSAQQMPNGNILICKGPQGEFFEIDTNMEIVWKYINPITPSGSLTQGELPDGINSVFRILRYSNDYSAFDGKDLTPGGTLELYNVVSGINNYSLQHYYATFPNPVQSKFRVSGLLKEESNVSIYNIQGDLVKYIDHINPSSEIDVSELPNGIYLLSVNYGYLEKLIISR